jgi:hypothetical protein
MLLPPISRVHQFMEAQQLRELSFESDLSTTARRPASLTGGYRASLPQLLHRNCMMAVLSTSPFPAAEKSGCSIIGATCAAFFNTTMSTWQQRIKKERPKQRQLEGAQE